MTDVPRTGAPRPTRAPRVLLQCPPLPGGPAHDVALGPTLLRHGLGDADEVVRVFSPAPTAAFSRRDRLRPGFGEAVAAVRRWGFEPVLRYPGGRLAAYHDGSVVVEHVCRRTGLDLAVDGRFSLYADQVASVLSGLGVDATVGEVPGEYCPGAFTVNGGGTVKLAGSAQRVTRQGWLFSTIVQVTGAARLRPPLAEASEALGYALDLATVGAVEDLRPGTSVDEVARALAASYSVEGAEVVTALTPSSMRLLEDVAAANTLDA